MTFPQVETSLEESVINGSGWLDVNGVLPVSVTAEDIPLLLQEITSPSLEKAMVFGTIVVNPSVVTRAIHSFNTLITQKADEVSRYPSILVLKS